MRSLRLLYRLTAYYFLLSGLLLVAAIAFPEVRGFLPIGGVEGLIGGPPDNSLTPTHIASPQVAGFGGSLVWLAMAMVGSLLAAIPVSWTYMQIRARNEYSQALLETIVLLPLVVTGIVVIVQNSLALAFSLAGIAAGVRFRHSLKSPGDVVFILMAIGIGLSAGIGAVELAIIMSLAFNYCFLLIWINDYGARSGVRRFLSRDRPLKPEEPRSQAEKETG